MRLNLPVLLALAVTVSGCEMMTAPENDPMYVKTTELDNRLTRVERVVDNQSLGNLAARIDALQADTQALRSQLEELQYEMGQASDRQRQLYLDLTSAWRLCRTPPCGWTKTAACWKAARWRPARCQCPAAPIAPITRLRSNC